MFSVSYQGYHEERLISDIFNKRLYEPLARPVADEKNAVIVYFGLSLQQLINVVCTARIYPHQPHFVACLRVKEN